VECPEVFSHACLSTLRRVGDRIVKLPGVRNVSSLVDVTSFRYVAAEDWVEVRPFIEDIPEDPAALARLRERALADPVYRRTLVSPDARAAALNVSFRKMSDLAFISAGLDDAIRRILEQETAPDQTFHMAGRPHVKTRVYNGLVSDLRLLIPMAVAVVVAVLALVFGSRRGVVLPLGVALLSCLWTFGLMAALERSLTILTGLLGPTLLAIGSVYGVHLLTRYEEETHAGGSAREVVTRCLAHMRMPVGTAGFTTAVGFAALTISDVPAVVELGWFSVVGIAAVTTLSLTALPAALILMPVRSAVSPERAHALAPRLHARLDAALEALAGASERHATPILVVAGLFAVAAAMALPAIVIDTDYLSYFDPADPVRVEFEEVNRLLAGAVPLYVVVDGDGEGFFREPEHLHVLEGMQRALDGTAGVSRSVSILDTMRVLNRAFQADDPAQERIPDTRPGVTELMFMIPKNELRRFSTVNQTRANLMVRTGEVGSAAIRSLEDGIERVIDATALPPGATARVTGNALLLAHSADGIARSQPLSVGLAALAIFVLLTLGLRSLGLGAVAMIPNLLPVLLFFGLLGLGAAPLSLPTSLIGSVALGIAIDDTVHFLVRYRAERDAGASPESAALRCGRSVGRPIAITSGMLFLGFLVVAFSQFATLREFGFLTALTMVICLVNDLVLLPALLVRLRP
jgi:predicted RND superfamily exporter protein